MVDKNLFMYDLAITAIFKDEAHYIKEWLDYHLLAGVEHFYLYNNDSSDDYKEVLAPYVERNLVTLTDLPGKLMQHNAYNDALDKYRFDCRYMAFIDLDEFIFPKSNRSIVEVVEEILSQDSYAAALLIHWHCFGSNGQETADYSRGVLERFTRRAEKNFINKVKAETPNVFVGEVCNSYLKSIVKPAFVKAMGTHYAYLLSNHHSVKENGQVIMSHAHPDVCADKIVINHYFTKSQEEFFQKRARGIADSNEQYPEEKFEQYDRNEVFDDGILKYRDARAENFSFESDEHRVNRLVDALMKNLMQTSIEDSLVDKMETFLTCRAVAERLQIKIGEDLAEEIALAWIYRTLLKANPLTYAEVQMFFKALPKILARPLPICKDIKTLTQDNVIPRLCAELKGKGVRELVDTIYIQQLLRLIKL